MARRPSPVLSQSPEEAAAQEEQRRKALEGLVAIPGDTFAVRGELKAVGAVWDAAEKVWKIAPDRLSVAQAIVENQTLAPATALKAASEAAARAPVDVESLPDPFEGDGEEFRYVALGKRDGATYDARDTLKAVGARWDGDKKAWLIREDRADYARAVLAGASGAAAPAPQPAPPRGEAATRSNGTLAPAAQAKKEEPLPPPTQRTPNKMAERIKLGGLWLNKTRDGKEYLSGNLNGNVKILIFKNDYRTAENQPTHVMYLAPIEKEAEGPRPGAAPADGFFGVGNLPAGEDGGGEDYGDFAEADEAPTPAPARPGAARSAAQQRPAAAPPARPAPGGGRPAPQQRRPAPAANGDAGGGGGFDDFEDPFAD
jgi:hypothetical protein